MQRDWKKDVDLYFIQHIPATVPIVVGVVLLAMIGIVIIAYFVGKNKQDKKMKNKLAEDGGSLPDRKRGSSNPAFEMEEKPAKSDTGTDTGTSGGDKAGDKEDDVKKNEKEEDVKKSDKDSDNESKSGSDKL